MSKIVNSTLTVLKYNHNLLTDQMCDVQSIKNIYDLLRFRFKNKYLHPEDAIITGALVTSSEVTTFDISDNCIHDVGCECMIKQLLVHKLHLSSVDLSKNGLTSSCIQSVINLVQYSKTASLISHNSLFDIWLLSSKVAELDVSYHLLL